MGIAFFLGFFLNMPAYGAVGCASGLGSGLLLGPARACGLDWGGSSLGVPCSELSLRSVDSGSLCSESSVGWGLPVGVRNPSPSVSSESVSDEAGLVESSDSVGGVSSVVGGAMTAMSGT